LFKERFVIQRLNMEFCMFEFAEREEFIDEGEQLLGISLDDKKIFLTCMFGYISVEEVADRADNQREGVLNSWEILTKKRNFISLISLSFSLSSRSIFMALRERAIFMRR